MGPECRCCGYRCFYLRVIPDGRLSLLASCHEGMRLDRQALGVDHTQAVNPETTPVAAVAVA
jgi:hypothetical protein